MDKSLDVMNVSNVGRSNDMENNEDYNQEYDRRHSEKGVTMFAKSYIAMDRKFRLNWDA